MMPYTNNPVHIQTKSFIAVLQTPQILNHAGDGRAQPTVISFCPGYCSLTTMWCEEFLIKTLKAYETRDIGLWPS